MCSEQVSAQEHHSWPVTTGDNEGIVKLEILHPQEGPLPWEKSTESGINQSTSFTTGPESRTCSQARLGRTHPPATSRGGPWQRTPQEVWAAPAGCRDRTPGLTCGNMHTSVCPICPN